MFDSAEINSWFFLCELSRKNTGTVCAFVIPTGGRGDVF